MEGGISQAWPGECCGEEQERRGAEASTESEHLGEYITPAFMVQVMLSVVGPSVHSAAITLKPVACRVSSPPPPCHIFRPARSGSLLKESWRLRSIGHLPTCPPPGTFPGARWRLLAPRAWTRPSKRSCGR